MLVVFDANVWVSQLALNSPTGAAVRYFLKKTGATVVVPEVIRLEIERNLTAHLSTLARRAKDSHRQLLAVFGNLKEIVLPNDEEIAAKVSEVLETLDIPARDMRFSVDVARSALVRVMDKIPPAHKSQEYKDCVVWAHCVDLLEEDDLFLLTEDKTFYEDKNYEKGLSHVLQEEIADARFSFTISRELTSLLEAIRIEVTIPDEALVTAYMEQFGERAEALLDRERFEREGPPAVTTRLFATEDANRLFVEFEMNYCCTDSTEEGRSDCVLKLSGKAMYDDSDGSLVDMRQDGECLSFKDEEGEQMSRNIVIGAGSIVLGHRTEQLRIRTPLD